MTSAIHLLSNRLAQSMAHHVTDDQGLILLLPKFAALTNAAQVLAHQFDPGKVPEPEAKLRKEAIARLRDNEASLSSRDWKLISWGLSDPNEKAPCLLDDTPAYEKIYRYVDSKISTKNLSRKLWFGLSFSYFAYSHDTPEIQPNWNRLQDQIRKGFLLLDQQQKRKHAWTQVVTDNIELFESNAGQKLGRAIFNNDHQALLQIQEYLPIPEKSWLWQRIIKEQLKQLFTIQDHQFRPRIEGLLTQAQQLPRYTDDILAATLTRYANTTFKDEPHPALKDFVLAAWGSPQLKSAKNKWATYVKDNVCKMVLRWFAKDDLEHFFKLLQGESGVDEARLHYWLRFVDQMNYTRIVLGTDAKNDRSPDFVDFRQTNKARLSYLSGAPSKDSAFIMQIGEYYIVEFSGTGNATFIYHTPPFNPDATHLIQHDLKQRPRTIEYLRHSNGWAEKFDAALRKLGISTERSIQKNPKEIPWPQTAMQQKTTPISSSSQKTDAAIKQSKLLLSALPTRIVTNDFREKGGAYWILLPVESGELATQLRRLGFGFVPSKGFWIK